jgi:hypothetical protein
MGERFSSVEINQRRFNHDRDPEQCPLCHYAVEAEHRYWQVLEHREDTILEIVLRCPRTACRRLFIARYQATVAEPATSHPYGLFVLFEVVPQLPRPPDVPEEIRIISPLFVEIVSEATAAEAFGLKQVAGVGYRKALEFLIKDYCI